MKELNKRIITSLILLLIFIISLFDIILFLLLVTVVNFLSLIELNNIFKKIFKKKKFFQFIIFLISSLYMTGFTLIIWNFLMPSFEILKFTVIFILLIIISTDIGGFIFGKLIGGKKLTKISPKKTYAGSCGSFIFSLMTGLIYYKYFSELVMININIIVLTLLISFFSQCGDLIISFFKRKAKIKDTGSILPGHGGILDRIDGVLFALPLGIIIFSIQ